MFVCMYVCTHFQSCSHVQLHYDNYTNMNSGAIYTEIPPCIVSQYCEVAVRLH